MAEFVEVVCGVDIGGSHLGVGLYNHKNNSQLCSYEESLHSVPPEQLVDRVVEIVRDLQKKLEYRTSLISIGVGFPGQSKNGILVAASNFPNWKMVPLANMISSKLDNIPATLINDADAAIAAEVWGTDKYTNIRHAAMITLGTGIGCGLILDGRLYSGANGLIEGGHMIVDPHSENRCGCGQRGCIESYASAKNASLKMERLSLLSSHGGESGFSASIDGSKGLFQRAANGDPNAQQVLHEVADYLGVFCVNICRLVDPEVIIFGGGMSHAGETLLKLVRESMMKYTWTVLPTDVRLEIAQQVGDAGMMGAALSAQSLYTHLHPTHTSSSHSTEQQQPPQPPSSSPPPPSPSPSSSSSLISHDLLLAGIVSISTGLSFLYLSKKFPSSSSSSPLPFSFPHFTSSQTLICSHAILVGLHLFGIFSWRKSQK